MSLIDDDPDLARHWQRWTTRRDQSARDHLLVHYSPLVKFVAGRVGAGLPSTVEVGDLVSSGIFGLIDAVERFEPERGLKFETFATPRIRGAILDALRSLDWVPRSVRSRSRSVQDAISALEQRLGRSPSDEELAEHLEIDVEELGNWLAGIARTTVGPLDRAIDAGLDPVATDQRGHQSPDDVIQEDELRSSMRDEIRRLPERERLVLSLYYDEGLTLVEIGQVIGVTESRVSQIHTKAVLQLRSRLAAADRD